MLGALSPGFIFLAGVVGRYGAGLMILSLLSREMVIEGEFAQYIVAWRYSSDIAGIWFIYISCFALAFFCLGMMGKFRGKSRKTEPGITSVLVRSGQGGEIGVESKYLTSIGLLLLSFFFVGSISAAVTGSFDRGMMYQYWASQTFRPEAVFIAFSRLRQVAYFFVPFILRQGNRKIQAVVCILAVIPIVLDLISGGRGSALYPVVMMIFGAILTGMRNKKMVIGAILTGMLIVSSLPYIAAYRDSVGMQSDYRDWGGRLKAFISVRNSDELGYRVQALGREVYACSDSFLFTPRNRNKRGVGFRDIDLERMAGLLVPRVISEEKRLEKNDGSRIAQSLMNTNIANWFPCITTPADLLRRGGYTAVGVGGLLMGTLIRALETGWQWVGERISECTKTLLLVLPASYIQSGLYGTVQETVWQIGWELPKYVAVIVLLGWVTRITYQVFERPHYER